MVTRKAIQRVLQHIHERRVRARVQQVGARWCALLHACVCVSELVSVTLVALAQCLCCGCVQACVHMCMR